MNPVPTPEHLAPVIEALLLAAETPLTIEQLRSQFDDEARPGAAEIREAFADIEQANEGRALQLKEVASGWRLQIRQDYAPWVSQLFSERAPRYSRALLETLAIIAYRQPVTRAEIEEIRGVSVSTNIIRTLEDREWVKVIGHREVPGRPAIYATTPQFLDYFDLKSLEALPALSELVDLDSINVSLDLPMADGPPTETPRIGLLTAAAALATKATDEPD